MTTVSGIVQALPGADFPNYANKAFPNLSSLGGLYYFGPNAASSTPNMAPGATVDLTSNGTPTYSDGHVSLDSTTDYFSSGITVSEGQTLFVVMSKFAATEAVFVTGVGYIIVRGNGANSNQVRADGLGSGGTCVATFNPGADFGFIAVTHAGFGGALNLYTGSGGSLTTTTNGAAAVNYTAQEVLIGPSYAPSTGGTHKIACAGFADSVLNATQVEEIYDYLRYYLPRRGITVV